MMVFTNVSMGSGLRAELERGVAPARVVVGEAASILVVGKADPAAMEAEVIFGQPPVDVVMGNEKLRFVQLTTAGYTRYDRADVRARLSERGVVMANASTVFAEPCAQHALMLMLCHARQMGPAAADQLSARSWVQAPMRQRSVLLGGQHVVIVGYGAIGMRLVELLRPFGVAITAVRRTPRGDEGVETVGMEAVDALLPRADHVMNILPEGPGTVGYFDARRLGLIKRGAAFYNIGRGTTVDQAALVAALGSGELAGAYLDVTDPEPLPSGHPLWTTPNCWITPHTAGGFVGENEALVRHFVSNYKRFSEGKAVRDRIFG